MLHRATQSEGDDHARLDDLLERPTTMNNSTSSSGRRDLMMVDEIGRGEDEHLAHHVGVLLVPLMSPSTRPPVACSITPRSAPSSAPETPSAVESQLRRDRLRAASAPPVRSRHVARTRPGRPRSRTRPASARVPRTPSAGHHSVRDRRKHVAVIGSGVSDFSWAHDRTDCARDGSAGSERYVECRSYVLRHRPSWPEDEAAHLRRGWRRGRLRALAAI